MKSNAKKLTNLIKSLLTPDKERQLKEIFENKEQLDKIKPFQGESLTWESMQNLVNFDINDEDMTKNGLVTRWSIPTARNILHSRTRLNVNKKMNKRVVGSSAHFFQYLFNKMNANATLCGRYNYENISKCIKKAPGNNIFNLNNIYFIINIDNNHWAYIVVYMEEKRIQY
jgi:hypothetical protein